MSKKNKVIITLVIIVIILVIITTVIIMSFNKKEYTSVNDFTSVKEVVEYLGCKYISEDVLSEKTNIYLKFKYPPYENGTSYEKFYNQLVGMIAEVLEYRNFNLYDKEKDIFIAVNCDEYNETITKYTINESENYFSDIKSQEAIDNYTQKETVESTLQSVILSQCINKNWNYSDLNFGTAESTFLDYDIYFDEGIQVKELDGKIYNIVFTNKYTTDVINNIKVGESFDNIINILGEPKYGASDQNIIGYKTKHFYIFFSISEISVYRIEQFDTTEFAKIVEEFVSKKDSYTLLYSLRDLWSDFDYYYDDNEGSIIIKYSLKGIKAEFNYSNQHGIMLYDEFYGNITPNISLQQVIDKKKELPQYVYLKNTSLSYETEQERINRLILDDYADFGSDEFYAIVNNYTDDGGYNLMIISKSDNYPNSEIEEYMDSSVWIDNYNFAYGINGQGIYIYNAQTRTKKTLITGTNEFLIDRFENGLLYYDDTSIKVSL